jgi:adenylate kinase family enzyme
MSLFLITGLPGSGKSTVCSELKSRGYTAYDGDEDHLAEWYNNKTEALVKVTIDECTPEFLRHHSRDISREIIKELAAKAGNEPVFLCGDPENEEELQDLFTKIFALVVDEGTLKYRLATRTNNPWGKLPHELEYSFAFREKWHSICRKFSYIMIDATRPTKHVVDQILEQVDA